jgi:prepilin-type processing-associated H-X9-DG protein
MNPNTNHADARAYIAANGTSTGKTPTECVIVFDTFYASPHAKMWAYPDRNLLAQAHMGKANMLFADGHVENIWKSCDYFMRGFDLSGNVVYF